MRDLFSVHLRSLRRQKDCTHKSEQNFPCCCLSPRRLLTNFLIQFPFHIAVVNIIIITWERERPTKDPFLRIQVISASHPILLPKQNKRLGDGGWGVVFWERRGPGKSYWRHTPWSPELKSWLTPFPASQPPLSRASPTFPLRKGEGMPFQANHALTSRPQIP